MSEAEIKGTAAPLTAKVQDGMLTISVGVDVLALAAMRHDAWDDETVIENTDAFASIVCREAASMIDGGLTEQLSGDYPPDLHGVVVGAAGDAIDALEAKIEAARTEARRLPDHLDVDKLGRTTIRGSDGYFLPLDAYKPHEILMDELVRELHAKAKPLHDGLSEFKMWGFGETEALQALVADKYAATIGGEKGNATLTTIDGLKRFEIKVKDQLEFGMEINTAETILTELMDEWSSDSRAEIRALVMRAFKAGEKGKISRGDIFRLLKVESEEPRWNQAMQAIRDSMRVFETKVYLRIQERPVPKGSWKTISLDLAAV